MATGSECDGARPTRKGREDSLVQFEGSPPAPLTHYCIVRTDLPLGAIAAQLVHAAGESSPGNLPTNTFAVVLEVGTEGDLRRIEECLLLQGIAHVAVREPDPPYLGQLMAIGVVPCRRETVRSVLRSLRLFGKESSHGHR